METLFEKAIEQVPNLAVLSLIVWLFLKHLREQNAESASRHAEQAAALVSLNKENLEASRHARQVIEENTRAAAANTNALNNMSMVVSNLTVAVKQKT